MSKPKIEPTQEMSERPICLATPEREFVPSACSKATCGFDQKTKCLDGIKVKTFSERNRDKMHDSLVRNIIIFFIAAILISIVIFIKNLNSLSANLSANIITTLLVTFGLIVVYALALHILNSCVNAQMRKKYKEIILGLLKVKSNNFCENYNVCKMLDLNGGELMEMGVKEFKEKVINNKASGGAAVRQLPQSDYINLAQSAMQNAAESYHVLLLNEFSRKDYNENYFQNMNNKSEKHKSKRIIIVDDNIEDTSILDALVKKTTEIFGIIDANGYGEVKGTLISKINNVHQFSAYKDIKKIIKDFGIFVDVDVTRPERGKITGFFACAFPEPLKIFSLSLTKKNCYIVSGESEFLNEYKTLFDKVWAFNEPSFWLERTVSASVLLQDEKVPKTKKVYPEPKK